MYVLHAYRAWRSKIRGLTVTLAIAFENCRDMPRFLISHCLETLTVARSAMFYQSYHNYFAPAVRHRCFDTISSINPRNRATWGSFLKCTVLSIQTIVDPGQQRQYSRNDSNIVLCSADGVAIIAPQPMKIPLEP